MPLPVLDLLLRRTEERKVHREACLIPDTEGEEALQAQRRQPQPKKILHTAFQTTHILNAYFINRTAHLPWWSIIVWHFMYTLRLEKHDMITAIFSSVFI